MRLRELNVPSYAALMRAMRNAVDELPPADIVMTPRPLNRRERRQERALTKPS